MWFPVFVRGQGSVRNTAMKNSDTIAGNLLYGCLPSVTRKQLAEFIGNIISFVGRLQCDWASDRFVSALPSPQGVRQQLCVHSAGSDSYNRYQWKYSERERDSINHLKLEFHMYIIQTLSPFCPLSVFVNIKRFSQLITIIFLNIIN